MTTTSTFIELSLDEDGSMISTKSAGDSMLIFTKGFNACILAAAEGSRCKEESPEYVSGYVLAVLPQRASRVTHVLLDIILSPEEARREIVPLSRVPKVYHSQGANPSQDPVLDCLGSEAIKIDDENVRLANPILRFKTP
jgi:hypothetical protein